jgi:hypothetical protein
MAKQDIKATNVTDDEKQFIRDHDGLSDSTRRARWIHSPDEDESRKGETLATRSHDVIEAWARARGAKPATVPGTEHDGRPGVLRFNFPDYDGEGLQEIDWDEWFASFDARALVFLFQEHKTNGDQSNFFQLDNPDREDG